jgi:ribosomal protein uL24
MADWTSTWKASKQPRKQRSYTLRAPLHVRSAMMGSHLSKTLRDTHKTRSLRVRTGDKVKVLRGALRGKSGKVERVDTRNSAVYITGIEMIRKDGSKSMTPVHPSNLLIEEIHNDKRRLFKPAKEKKQ